MGFVFTAAVIFFTGPVEAATLEGLILVGNALVNVVAAAAISPGPSYGAATTTHVQEIVS